jgi:hypothetical protein
LVGRLTSSTGLGTAAQSRYMFWRMPIHEPCFLDRWRAWHELSLSLIVIAVVVVLRDHADGLWDRQELEVEDIVVVYPARRSENKGGLYAFSRALGPGMER